MKTNTYFATGADMLQRIIAPFDFNLFMLYMPILLDLARGMADKEDTKRRGYLTLMDGITGKIAFTVPFGEIPDEKREKYFKFSQEKARRLFSNLCLSTPHTTSFQSRNEEKEKYGGAIFVDYHSSVIILSFSGMPELIDEAMMVVLADRLSKEIHKPVITKIEAWDRNPYWNTLMDKFQTQLADFHK